MLLRCLLALMILLLPACAGKKVLRGPDSLPSAARKNFEQGYRLAQAGQAAVAIRYFEAARKTAPRHPPLLLNLGLAHGQLQHHGAAAAWLNAYLLSGIPLTQQTTPKQQYEQEKTAARTHTDRLLQLALQQLFQQLEGGVSPELKSTVKLAARDMASGGDIYGALQLLVEVDKRLSSRSLPALERTAWLAEARDLAWQAHAQTLVYTRQGVLADQARGHIQNRQRRDSFWWDLAQNPAQQFTILPAPLRQNLEWVLPLALHYETDRRQQEQLKARIARNPSLYAQARPDLLTRALQLAVLLSDTETRLPAALSAPGMATLAASDAPATLLVKRASELNTLLFFLQATELERHMDFTP